MIVPAHVGVIFRFFRLKMYDSSPSKNGLRRLGGMGFFWVFNPGCLLIPKREAPNPRLLPWWRWWGHAFSKVSSTSSLVCAASRQHRAVVTMILCTHRLASMSVNAAQAKHNSNLLKETKAPINLLPILSCSFRASAPVAWRQVESAWNLWPAQAWRPQTGTSHHRHVRPYSGNGCHETSLTAAVAIVDVYVFLGMLLYIRRIQIPKRFMDGNTS